MREEVIKLGNETRERLEKKDMDEFNKETILKIINLNENLSDEKTYENIEKKLRNMNFEENKVKENIILMKIKSILDDIKKKKYDKKISYQNYTIYYYTSHVDIFIEEKDTENIMKEINNIENAKSLKIFEGKKQLILSEKINSPEVISIINENRINPIKIRIEL